MPISGAIWACVRCACSRTSRGASGGVDNSGACALRMGKGLGHRLDQTVAEDAHLFSFRVAFSAAASAETARRSSGVMSP